MLRGLNVLLSELSSISKKNFQSQASEIAFCIIQNLGCVEIWWVGQKDSPLESNLCSALLRGMSERLTTKLVAGEMSEAGVAAEGAAADPCRVRRCFALRRRARRYCCGLRWCPGGRSR